MTNLEGWDLAYESFRARRVFGSLDGIRCLSILAVLWHHTISGFTWLPASHRGFLGVDMFFVLSGFLIVTLLLRERDRLGEVSLKRFYIRRSLRIFPVYYGLLAVLTLVFLLRPQGKTAQTFFQELPFYLAYLTNWFHPTTLMAIAWSLAVEEQFYLLWPPMERCLRGSVVGILLMVIAASQVPDFGPASQVREGWWGVLAGLRVVGRTYTPICLGVLLAHVLHAPRGYRRVARILFPPWMSLAALAALVVTCNLMPLDLAAWSRLSIQLLMMVFLASCVVREDHWLRGFLGWAPVARIGVVSYGIYLYHMIALHGVSVVLARAGWRFPLDQFFLVLLATWIIAELSYRYYEMPFLRLKDAYQRRAGVPIEGVSQEQDRLLLGPSAMSAIQHQRA
jgi:peptidoglycan/LPS O-acetylase OafA/YrhL